MEDNKEIKQESAQSHDFSTIEGLKEKLSMSRRTFLANSMMAGAALTMPRFSVGQMSSASDEIQIGLIGAGSQGRVLMNAVLKIPNVRFKAVCDIWEYSQLYASKVLEKFDQPVNVYARYQEMLEKENLDAVLIATPDWLHAPMTVDCLKAGMDVYCEKEMSNTVEGAQSMVKAARESGKLLQIGHQRRSNPRYKHALKVITKDNLLGRITTINGQWNRPVQPSIGWPEKYTMEDSYLQQFGYKNMDQFRNWRWYKKYAGGPIVDLGSHQIEVFNWFLGANPTSVMASGGIDYYEDGREWYDNVMTIYKYDTDKGPARAFYQVLNTTSYGGFHETFMGDEGTMVISEDKSKGYVFREARAKRREWEDLSEKVDSMGREAIELKIGETRRQTGEASPEVLKAEADLEKPEHQPHLENFFAAMRKEEELNCDAEVAYETCVTVLKVNEAVKSKCTLEFAKDEFHVKA